ncbi:MAG: hemolysin III family protein, partial [Alphaproteobacteria bacterium]|nr:hemolysin III family protein [Alphaproteobacteria bacterium]
MFNTAHMQRPYTIVEEICNCSIHGLGIILSIAGLVILAAFSSVYGNAWTIVSTVIFGVSMILLYTASTIYHAIPNEHAKRILKKF